MKHVLSNEIDELQRFDMKCWQISTLLLAIATALDLLHNVACRVLELGPKLPDFIKEHPDKSWLIKFYAPWCHHCQQLETTFIKVSEEIHRQNSNLIVGGVDCTKNRLVCEKYNVQAYPTVMYLSQKSQIKYKGDRSAESLIDFANRVYGPDVKKVEDCSHLDRIRDMHEFSIVSVGQNSFHETLRRVASSYKSTYWFYEIHQSCQDVGEGLYILKRHLKRAIRFKIDSQDNDIEKKIIDWILRESFPVFGPLNEYNFERIMALDKTLLIAVLDEYKPARKITRESKELYNLIEKFAKKYVDHEDSDFLFLWTSDLDLIQKITIREVVPPNFLILNSNYSYHLAINNAQGSQKPSNSIPEGLRERKISMLIRNAAFGRLTYEGGSTYMREIYRYIYGNYLKFNTLYRANPLLSTVLIGMPSVIVIFVIYTTCYHEPTVSDREDEDEVYDADQDDDRQRLINHAKQD